MFPNQKLRCSWRPVRVVSSWCAAQQLWYRGAQSRGQMLEFNKFSWLSDKGREKDRTSFCFRSLLERCQHRTWSNALKFSSGKASVRGRKSTSRSTGGTHLTMQYSDHLYPFVKNESDNLRLPGSEHLWSSSPEVCFAFSFLLGCFSRVFADSDLPGAKVARPKTVPLPLFAPQLIYSIPAFVEGSKAFVPGATCRSGGAWFSGHADFQPLLCQSRTPNQTEDVWHPFYMVL